MNIAASGRDFLDRLAGAANQVVSNILERAFGQGVHQRVAGPVTWVEVGTAASILLLAALANALVAFFFHQKRKEAAAKPETKVVQPHFLRAVAQPLHFFIWLYAVYVAIAPILLSFPAGGGLEAVRQFVGKFLDVGLFVALFWLFFRLTHVLDLVLANWAHRSNSKLDDILVPLVGKSLRVIVPVIGIIFALPLLGLPQEYSNVLAKGSSILIISAIAWILFQGVHLTEQAIMAKFDITAADNLRARKVYTQVHVISKTVYIVIGIFTLASVLMLFEEARRLGTSILASAGVLGVVLGFAAQHTIANLFAGFQIALAQPIRLDDVVIVETEWGRVEEITLTYVVVHIWDDRRMILPLSYFIEKPFQNWTRASAQLLGSVFLWTDYTLPVVELREAVGKIVQASKLWDGRFWNLQVSDATEHTMQLRVLATAADSSKAWDLRCEIRENLIRYVQEHYPDSLPRTRVSFDQRLENRLENERLHFSLESANTK